MVRTSSGKKAVGSESVLGHVTKIKGLKETPQEIALRALRSITRSVAFSADILDIPRDLLFGENVDLHRWSMILKDSALEQLSRQQESGQRFSLNTTASSLPEMFTTFWALLPATYSVSLLHLNIANGKDVTDYGLTVVAKASPSLRSLNIAGCALVTDMGLREVALACPKLTDLNIASCHGLTGPGLLAIADCCPFVAKLNISRCNNIQNYSLQKLFRKITHLEELVASYSKEITDEELRVMAEHCPDFLHLEAVECKNVSDQAILNIAAHCKDLDYVDLSRTEFASRVTDVTLMALGQRCPSLRTLKLNHCEHITDVGLGWLTDGCKVIETLELNGCNKITDAGLRVLGANCRALTFIDISQAKSVSDIGIASLSRGCRALRKVQIAGIFFLSDPRLPPATPSSSSTSLSASGKRAGSTVAGPEPWEELIGLNALTANCPIITELDLSGCFRLNKALAQALPSLSGLRVLNLKTLNQMTPQSLIAVVRSCTQLSELTLSDTGRAVTNEVLQALQTHCAAMKTLVLCRCSEVRGPGVKAISLMSDLERLDLSGCTQLTDSSLVHLSALGSVPKLRFLDLCDLPKMTDSFVAWFAMKEHCVLHLAVRSSLVSQKALQSVRDRFPHSELLYNANFVGYWPKNRVFDRILVRDYQRMVEGIVKIQSRLRKHMATLRVAFVKEHRRVIAAHLVAHRVVRGFLARRRTRELRRVRDLHQTSALKITSIFRMIIPKKKLKRLRYQHYLRNINTKAMVIQRAFRCFLARRALAQRKLAKQERFLFRVRCAVKIQSVGRMFLGSQRVQRLREHQRGIERRRYRQATVIQRYWRGFRARKITHFYQSLVEQTKQLRERCASLIQYCFRRHRTRSIVSERVFIKRLRNENAIKIQALIRGALARLRTTELAMETLAERRRRAAIKIQCRYRVFLARMRFFRKIKERRRLKKKQNQAATIINRQARMKLARKRLQQKKREYMQRLQAEEERVIRAATTIQALIRRYLGRIKYLNKLREHKGKWKELFDEQKQKRFFYNKLTGEIRWRIPQDLLDLVPHPQCDDCQEIEAILECKVCNELYCGECFQRVHKGGRRKDHEYRAIYDFYGKRIDYGDGVFPCQWPTEVIQDEIQGWMLRIAPHRVPHKVYAASGWEEYHFTEDEVLKPTSIFRKNMDQERVHNSFGKQHPRIFYFNRHTFQSTYEMPPEVAAAQYAETIAANDLVVPRTGSHTASASYYQDPYADYYYQQHQQQYVDANGYYYYPDQYQQDPNAQNNNHGYPPYPPYQANSSDDVQTSATVANPLDLSADSYDYSAYGYYNEEGDWVWYDSSQNNAHNFDATANFGMSTNNIASGARTPSQTPSSARPNVYSSQGQRMYSSGGMAQPDTGRSSAATPRRAQRRAGYQSRPRTSNNGLPPAVSEDSGVAAANYSVKVQPRERNQTLGASLEDDGSVESQYAALRTSTDVHAPVGGAYRASDGQMYNHPSVSDDSGSDSDN